MSRRPHRLLLEDMLAAVSKVQQYTFGLDKAQFVKDDKTIDAVIRNLQVIGEAATVVELLYSSPGSPSGRPRKE